MGENQEKEIGRDAGRGGTQLDLATVSKDEPAVQASPRPELDEMVTAGRPTEGDKAAQEMRQLINLASAGDAGPIAVDYNSKSTGLHGVMFTDSSSGAGEGTPSPVERVAGPADQATAGLPPADTVLHFAKQNFAEIDANKDNHVTADEIDQFIINKQDLTGQQVAELNLLKQADVEEAANDETGDENDGITTADLEAVIDHLAVVDYAEKNFDRFDGDGDGHVTGEDIDKFLTANAGKLDAGELEMIQKLKERIGDLEEHADDEFGDENDGYTRHDLAAARTEYGVLAFKSMEPAQADNAPANMQEALEYAQQNFQKVDADQDGHITAEDIDKYIEANKATLTPRDTAHLEMLKQRVSDLEEQSNDETGDENDGITAADLSESLKKIGAVEYAQDHFHEIDGNGDGQITAEEIDGYSRARGPMNADEYAKLEWLKKNVGDLEEMHDDETGDENDGFSKHDLIDTLAELGANTRKPRVERTAAPQQQQEVPADAAPPPAPSPENPADQQPAQPPEKPAEPQETPPAEPERPVYPRSERWGGRDFTANEDGGAEYQVQEGDSLWKVARDVLRHRTGKEPSAREIVKMVGEIVEATNSDNDSTNDIRDPERIYPGQKLRIPPGETAAPRRRTTPDAGPGEQAPRGQYDYHQGDGSSNAPEGRDREASPLHDPSLEAPPAPARRVAQGQTPYPANERGQQEWPQHERGRYPEQRPGEGPYNRRIPVPEPEEGRPTIPDNYKRPRGRRLPERQAPDGDTAPPDQRQPRRPEVVAPPVTRPEAQPRQEEVQPRRQAGEPVSILKFMADNFKEFDTDGDGHVTAEDIDKTIEKHKDKLGPAELAKLQKVKERIGKLEELSDDETGDENDGIHLQDLQEAMKQEELLEYATTNFDNLDVDGDGHVSEDDIDKYTRARMGRIDGAEMEKLQALKERVGDIEEAYDDEFSDEDNGFTRHDLLEYAKENGLDADELGAATDAAQEGTPGMPAVASEAGYLKAIKDQFQDFDLDKDGYVTQDELDQFMQKNKDKLGAEGLAVLQRIRDRVGNLEELADDETGDENDGFSVKDLQTAIEAGLTVEYAKRTFSALDTDQDGHVTEGDIDAYIKANSGKISAQDIAILNKLKEKVGELEEGNDDEYGDENDGFTQHDLIAAAKELGLS